MTINLSEDTINKSILLNWLRSADDDISMTELGKLIAVRTGGRYTLVRQEKTDIGSIDIKSALENTKNILI